MPRLACHSIALVHWSPYIQVRAVDINVTEPQFVHLHSLFMGECTMFVWCVRICS